MQPRAARLPQVLVLLMISAVCLPSVKAQWTQAQATWYDGVFAGACGFFNNIPQNQFVAAWPMIEDGPPGSGLEHWQPGLSGNACGQCVEVRCTPGFVENSLGSIYLDRTQACRDTSLGIVVKIIDECRCSGADLALSDRGNFNWCCNVPTPRLKIDRHVDLSRAAFTQLIKDGDYGLGLMNIQFRPASCDYIGLTRIQSDGTSAPLSGGSPTDSPTNSPTTPPASPPAASPPATPTTSPDNTATSPSPSVPSQPSPPSSSPSEPSPSPSSPSEPSPPAPQPPQPPPATGNDVMSAGEPAAVVLSHYSQCGGTGGNCHEAGGDAVCGDMPFAGQSCDAGLTCVRQNVWYWQCLTQSELDLIKSQQQANWKTEPVTPEGCNKLLGVGQQCGGAGGNCQGGDCVDQQASGVCCESGSYCKRFDAWYWECRPEGTK